MADNQRTRSFWLAAVVGICIGWFAATSAWSPVRPEPQHDRPVLKFLARLARAGLWVMLFAEPPPSEKNYIVHARVDERGDRVLNHGEGW
jgi:hypothetical protein